MDNIVENKSTSADTIDRFRSVTPSPFTRNRATRRRIDRHVAKLHAVPKRRKFEKRDMANNSPISQEYREHHLAVLGYNPDGSPIKEIEPLNANPIPSTQE